MRRLIHILAGALVWLHYHVGLLDAAELCAVDAADLDRDSARMVVQSLSPKEALVTVEDLAAPHGSIGDLCVYCGRIYPVPACPGLDDYDPDAHPVALLAHYAADLDGHAGALMALFGGAS